MLIDPEKTPFLFSVGTRFSNRIDQEYYHNTHYVWCTPKFNDFNQPVTSRPHTICKRYLEQIVSGDRHTEEINKNKSGILRGAQEKWQTGIINKKQYKEISQLVNCAKYKDFAPVLYVIDARKVGCIRCEEVDEKEKASNTSEEYIIKDLAEGEYELINIGTMLTDCVAVADKKAGE